MEERIYEIIACHIVGERLSQEELGCLEQWLQESPEHRQIYERLNRMYVGGLKFRSRKGIDHQVAFDKIRRRIIAERSVARRSGWRRMAGYAAGLVLLTGLGFGILWRSFAPQPDLQKTVSSETCGVRLELADGRRIELASALGEIVVTASGVAAACDSNILNYPSDIQFVNQEKISYNTLIVPTGAEYRLLLSDGTLVYMNAASELRYPVVFPGDQREVFLKGEAYFEVSSDTARKFLVRTEGMDIRVMGTMFNVSAYPEAGSVVTTLTSGKIQALCAGQVYDVLPGQQICHDLRTDKVKTNKVNTDLYTSWKDGYYYFEECHLDEILQTLSKWYGFDVFYANPDVREMEFTGRLKRYDEVEKLFSKFEQTRNISFSMNGNTLTVAIK